MCVCDTVCVCDIVLKESKCTGAPNEMPSLNLQTSPGVRSRGYEAFARQIRCVRAVPKTTEPEAS